jgi:hypothetical protein
MGPGQAVQRDPETHRKALRRYKIGGAEEPSERMKDAVMARKFLFCPLSRVAEWLLYCCELAKA